MEQFKFRYIPLGKAPENYAERSHRPKVYVDLPDDQEEIPEGYTVEAEHEYLEPGTMIKLQWRDGDFWQVE
jgi:hypothetical protein